MATYSSLAESIRQALRAILVFIGLIWAGFLVDWVVPVDFNRLGLVPRTASGLIGIVVMPFLHGDFSHLLSNTIPLFVLLALLAGSRVSFWRIVTSLALLSGLLLWLFGRPAVHIGASGLVFALAAFLVVAGFLERRLLAVLIAGVVLFLYGGSMLAGVLPWRDVTVSWDGHLAGAIAGGLVAYFHAKRPTEKGRTTV